MITKLNPANYLKRRNNMDLQERMAYDQLLTVWLQESKPMLLEKTNTSDAGIYSATVLSGAWNERECHAFEQGALLMSALIAEADTWLPDMLYTKTARRVVNRMIGVLEAAAQSGSIKDPQTAAPAPAAAPAPTAASAAQGRVVAPAVTTVKRPNHIDQYGYLLPEATQQRAAGVKDILRRLEEARQKMQTLIDGGAAHTDTQATWAREATRLDNELHDIYAELDREWDKLVKAGRVYVDDLGNAHVTSAEQQRLDAAAAEEQAHAKTEKGAGKKRSEASEMRRWLCDTRRGNGKTRPEYAKKWGEKFEVYVALVGDAAFTDDKINAAAKHYGIILKQTKK